MICCGYLKELFLGTENICGMSVNVPLERSAILLTCISDNWSWKPIFGLLFEWQLKTGFDCNRQIF